MVPEIMQQFSNYILAELVLPDTKFVFFPAGENVVAVLFDNPTCTHVHTVFYITACKIALGGWSRARNVFREGYARVHHTLHSSFVTCRGHVSGYVKMLTISSKDLHMKNSTSKGDSVVVNIEPNKLSR